MVKGPFMLVDEVEEIFGCGESKAYSIIRQMNKELAQQGFYTYPGRVSRKYFMERIYGGEEAVAGNGGE